LRQRALLPRALNHGPPSPDVPPRRSLSPADQLKPDRGEQKFPQMHDPLPDPDGRRRVQPTREPEGVVMIGLQESHDRHRF